LIVVLAVLGIVYSVIATRYYAANELSVTLFMGNSMFLRFLLGPFWFAVELAPITVVVALLRVNVVYAAMTVLFYEVIMNVVLSTYFPWNWGGFVAAVINMPWNFSFQIPVYGLTWLIFVYAWDLTRKSRAKDT